MSRLVDDVKSGLKGIRGAGEVIRGEAMEATDRVFDKNASGARGENKNISDKGMQDLRGMDEMFARREWEKKGVPRDAATAAVPAAGGENLAGTHRAAEGVHRVEPGMPGHVDEMEGLRAQAGGATSNEAPPLPSRHAEPGPASHDEAFQQVATKPVGELAQEPGVNPPPQPRYA